ncbi:MAG: DUF1801 domain-containing protein [Erysipelotrichaceae bacterium]|nr:DUF1801 domain-containing protein [Erysipelotrichaceae bacterium]
MKWICPKCGREFSRAEQPHYCGKPQTIDEYIASQDEKLQPRLKEIRAILREALPDAEERMSWSMPTYWKGRNLIHFAASKKHLGIYPGGEATTVFAEELRQYDVSKGTIRIPYEQPLPEQLIRKIAVWCYGQYSKL